MLGQIEVRELTGKEKIKMFYSFNKSRIYPEVIYQCVTELCCGIQTDLVILRHLMMNGDADSLAQQLGQMYCFIIFWLEWQVSCYDMYSMKVIIC